MNLTNSNIKVCKIESLKNRIFKIQDNVKIVLSIEATLPILITKDTYIDNLVVSEVASDISSTNTTLVDEEYTDGNRFTLFTAATSPLTKNKIYMYYDALYQDIILIPNIEFLELANKGNLYYIRGYRLGSGIPTDFNRANQLIPVDEKLVSPLSPTNSKVSVTTKLVKIPGIDPGNMLNTNKLEEQVGDINMLHGDSKLATFIKLGTGSTVFTDTSIKVPVYLLWQSTINEYGWSYIGRKDVSSLNMYLQFRF